MDFLALLPRQVRPAVSTIGAVMTNTGNDRIALVSGGVAFYAFLSIFPGIAFALMIWGLLTDGEGLERLLVMLEGVVPAEAYTLIANQMRRIAGSQANGLSWGLVISLLLTLWSASRAVNALLMAVALPLRAQPHRGFFHQNLIALTFTVGGMVFSLISLLAIGAVPPLLEAVRLGAATEIMIRLLRWVFVVGLFMIGALAFYRVAQRKPRPPLFSGIKRNVPGAFVAALIWLGASFGFSFYLAEFAAYNETFGSLGAVAALLMWFWLSAFAICVGAETNAELNPLWRRRRARDWSAEA